MISAPQMKQKAEIIRVNLGTEQRKKMHVEAVRKIIPTCGSLLCAPEPFHRPHYALESSTQLEKVIDKTSKNVLSKACSE